MLSLLIWLPFAQAWLAPVDFTADNEGTDIVKRTVEAVNSSDEYDRCDTATNIYTDPLGDVPNFCHRWNLVWEKLEGDQLDWAPEAGGAGYRLPTIKELVRMFDYTGGTGLAANPIIDYWLDGLETPDKKEWLITSSYRDIDGDYDQHDGESGRLQIFAINIATGEVKTFEPGKKSLILNDLQLCESLNNDGSGDCNLDSSHTVYAIKVKTDRLSEL